MSAGPRWGRCPKGLVACGTITPMRHTGVRLRASQFVSKPARLTERPLLGWPMQWPLLKQSIQRRLRSFSWAIPFRPTSVSTEQTLQCRRVIK
jgi:hypothetical protein